MIFNSIEFLLIFLPVTLIVFYSFGRKGLTRTSLFSLILASFIYYSYNIPQYLILLLISIVMNYGLSRFFIGIERKINKKIILIIGISINLLLLGYFKYFNFFIDNLNVILGFDFNLNKVILPIGISFFTFSQISFLIDSYRGIVEEKSFLRYCLFVSFFPQLFAGPIVYHREMAPQYQNNKISKFNFDYFTPGVIIFIIGLFKKVVIADNLSLYVTPIFDQLPKELDLISKTNMLDFVNSWKAALAYTFQLYFDFSGYSDMAIGIGSMFGIKLPINFNSPYKSNNIVEFWKRWHMTLSRFFRDYVFLPISFTLSRRIKIGSFLDSNMFIYSTGIMITWILTGLWHGAGWTFIAWGIIHAFLLIGNRLIKKRKRKIFKKLKISEKKIGISIIYQLLTFSMVVIAWVFFRSPDFKTAYLIISGMIGMNGFIGGSSSFDGSMLLFISSVIVFLMPNTQEFLNDFNLGIPTYNQVYKEPKIKLLRFNYDIKYSTFIALIFFVSILFIQTVQKSEFLYYDF